MSVTADTVWNVDMDNVGSSAVIIQAQYIRIYTIQYILCSKVRDVDVFCKFDNLVNVESMGLVKVSDYEYILENVREGDAIPTFPTVKPEDSNEYGFSSWKFGKTDKKKGVTVKAGTTINESNFKGTYESGVITLTVHCYSYWTPFY